MKTMRLTLGCLLAVAVPLAAQQPQQPQSQQMDQGQTVMQNSTVRSERVTAKNYPTETEMYCSGFISSGSEISKSNYVIGGWNTPMQNRFGQRDYIYLRGTGLQEGQELEILRPVKDLNQYEAYKGQRKDIKSHGGFWQEMGRVKVISVRNNNTVIGFVEMSCSDMTLGDIAVAWPDRPVPTYHRPVAFDRFAPVNGKLTTKIIGEKDFQIVAGKFDKIYLAAGASQGLKPGDYLRLTRSYEDTRTGLEGVESLPFHTVRDFDQTADAPKLNDKEITATLPRQSVGEAMVLFTTPTSATALVTDSMEYSRVGDMAELMDPIPPLPPPPPPPMDPPTISCAASPTTVHAGETTTIRCDAASPDPGHNVNVTFASDSGTLRPGDNYAVLDTSNTQPGQLTVLATAMDDRNLSTTTKTFVTVEATSAPTTPSMAGEFNFKPNSAYVDNRAKALLDGVALRLNQEPNSNALVAGGSARGEANRLSMLRGENAKTYLVREKGIDAGRITVRDRGQAGRTDQLWIVPVGAAPPVITPVAPVASPAPVSRPKARKPASQSVKH